MEVIQRKGRAATDAPDESEALGVYLEEAVGTSRPAARTIGIGIPALSTHDQAAVVVDALTVSEKNDRVLEVLRIHRQRVLLQREHERVAAVQGDSRSDAEVREACTPHSERERVTRNA